MPLCERSAYLCKVGGAFIFFPGTGETTVKEMSGADAERQQSHWCSDFFVVVILHVSLCISHTVFEHGEDLRSYKMKET